MSFLLGYVMIFLFGSIIYHPKKELHWSRQVAAYLQPCGGLRGCEPRSARSEPGDVRAGAGPLGASGSGPRCGVVAECVTCTFGAPKTT